MDFQPVKSPPNDPNIPSITIDLTKKEITVYLPENCGLITSRTISRRVDSIVRTGIFTPEDPPRRVGMKFNVQVLGSKERISPTLLVPGHEYGSGVASSVQEESVPTSTSPLTPTVEASIYQAETSSSVIPEPQPESTPVVPSPVEPVVEPTTRVTTASVAPQPVISPSEMVIQEDGTTRRDVEKEKQSARQKFGNLITELLMVCDDLYLTRLDGKKYHLESEHGAVVFMYDPDANKLDLVELSRFPEEIDKKLRSIFSQ